MAIASQMFEGGKTLWAASSEFLQVLRTLNQSGGSRAAMGWMAEYAVQACHSENEQVWAGLPRVRFHGLKFLFGKAALSQRALEGETSIQLSRRAEQVHASS